MAEALILKTVTPSKSKDFQKLQRSARAFIDHRCPSKHRVFHQNPHFRNPLPPSDYIINIILNFVLQYPPPQ
ncbi:hypothetical protein BCR42DRAFT_427132 [Absidia repens]|uniref:Uncharacterized protein n=1 Tax=Absidia repens TaxID=90262 RepID=A0A1X2I1E7_9FUNG|nr:hypothetical protein BCR42DRAFT_427132 [Absidia repens]